jgi:hypothetical protein
MQPELVLGRRRFLTLLGTSAAGAFVAGGFSACGGEGGTAPPPPPDDTGMVEGAIFDLAGTPRPSLGRIFLMDRDGRQTGRWVDVDPTAHFEFDDIAPGDWQLRFHAPRLAYVPEDRQHPVRFTVAPKQTVSLRIDVQVGGYIADMIEIYIGDNFFAEQPTGTENSETLVKLGTPVCWYNVGNRVHTVTGGPWGDSGDLERTQSFIWVADRLGTFGYRCRRHDSNMFATLRVVP